ncbi:MAG: 4,5-dioxygenase [Deltaproteobacteria bacterium]|nr:4,5-dioxygenase [Deltaproteobacteria bacterium]
MSKETALIQGYHAHVYYDPETREVAARVREGLAARFQVLLGSWHDNPVGPHPKSMYQVVFSPAQFGQIVPWLMLNREGLDILVHPETDDNVKDHVERCLWLGTKLKVDVRGLGR